ncbi:MAG: hypothetical protein HY904_26185 [Deltaproteobacteria bacterium]|nr:hypothetical protein [Deltaproteobacteria bacterium]
MTRHALVLPVFLLTTPALHAAPPPQPSAQQLAQQKKAAADGALAAARKKGLVVVKAEEPADVDGDGKLEVAAVVKDEREELALALFRATGPGQVAHVWTSNSTGAHEIKLFEVKQMVAEPRPEAVVELLEKSPDETRRQLRIYKLDESPPREVLTLSVVEESADKPEDSGERTTYGDDAPGFRVADVDGDGNVDVSLRREPRAVKARSRGDLPVTLVVGVKEVTYAWDKGRPGKYAARPDKALNFLPSLKLKKVAASSQKLPDDIKQMEQDKALEMSFEDAFGPEDGGAAAEDAPEPEINPAPRAYWATDNNFDSSWVESARGDGTGEWLELHTREEHEIRMVRVVPVCAGDEKDLNAHNEVVAFSLLTAGMGKTSVDRREKFPSDSGVLAVVEVPVPERKFAPQVLVFLRKGTRSSWVRLVIDKVKKHGKANEACIAEVSLH